MFSRDKWAPICSRVYISHLTTHHKDQEVFPYDAKHLASALKLLIDEPDICKKLEGIDLKEVPDHFGNQFVTEDAWYKAWEKDLKIEFEKSLSGITE